MMKQDGNNNNLTRNGVA